ncbi:MAG: gluconate 2-dehydrogenase subunit 3 family protein [Longimicrobiales bacterium]
MSTQPIDRRTALKIAAALPLSSAFVLSPSEADQARRVALTAHRAATEEQPYQRLFFNEHEWAMVRVLVDMIIPADGRSGSATDAGVPEFMDFVVSDQANRQTAMRGGLRWLDTECHERFEKTFVDCSDAERRQVLDAIAWPARARPEHSHGVAFFNSFRDLTASGFWSSPTGIDDLQYTGNTYVAEWTGCPPAALAKLGVRYND